MNEPRSQRELPVLADLPAAGARNVTLRIDRSGERALRRGHPWLFEAGVREQSHEGGAGDRAVIFDRDRKFLAVGLYDPGSTLRVRVLHRGKPRPIDGAFWSERLAERVALRAPLAGTGTDGMRLVNGENEGLPGLIVDRYGGTLVMKLYTPAWVPHLRDVVGALLPVQPCERVVLRFSRECLRRSAELHGLEDGQVVFGAALQGAVRFAENGLTFECDPVNGQKTGFFLDQRDNRARVERRARGARVLNGFAYSGGFSVYAARGGARHVVSLDQSRPALNAAERHFELNAAAVERTAHETLAADAFEALAALATAGRRFDLVVLDPPSFASRQSAVAKARAAYRRLVALGIGVLEKNGELVMASCSSRIPAAEFFELVLQTARHSGRRFVETERAEHALDHPIGFAEGAYLKCLYLREAAF